MRKLAGCAKTMLATTCIISIRRQSSWGGITPMSTLANDKRSCSKSGKHQAKIAFFLFFRLFFWHDFVTPFSTFANIKGSLPTKSTTPDRLRCLTKTDGEDFIPVFGSSNSNSLFIFEHQHEHRQKKLSQKVRHLVTICTPKEAQSRIFVTGGSFFVRQMLRAKNIALLGAASL